MKQFNLYTYNGEELCTRDGKKARIICDDALGAAPVIALITEDIPYRNDVIRVEVPHSYTKDGNFHLDGDESYLDLMIKPKYNHKDFLSKEEPNITHKAEELGKQYRTEDAYATTNIEYYKI